MASPTMGFVNQTGNNVFDAMTHGYVWVPGQDRQIDWSVSHGYLLFETSPNISAVAAAVNTALGTFSYFANIQFSFVGAYDNPSSAAAGGSEINVALGSLNTFFNSTSVWGKGFFPNSAENTLQYSGAPGDIFINIDSLAAFASYLPGADGWYMLIHELGHVLGLKHPHDSGGTGRPTLGDVGLGNFDLDVYTIMSYADSNPGVFLSRPATPMILDVLALQGLYGPNMTTNSGDTTFSLGFESLLQTFWDASGNDTASAEAQNVGWTILLPDYQLSSVVSTKAGFAVPTAELLAPLNGYWLAGDIENAIGGSAADELIGSSLANRLIGNGGDDFIGALGGNDSVIGGPGKRHHVRRWWG